MRVTQRTMYSNATSNMNDTLAAYMESNMQGASMKQVNRPSDDPAGMARILMYRASLGDISQYQRNLNTAEGWLKTADKTLTLGDSGVTSLLTLIVGKAEQGATSTMTPENRAQIASAVREYFGSLLNASNMRFEGKSIFAGLNYDSTAFQEGLAADCESPDFKQDLDAAQRGNPPDWIRFDGPMSKSALVRFPAGGVIPPPAAGAPLEYEYTTDAGKTWVTGHVPPGSRTIDLGGATMTLPVNPATGEIRVPKFDPDNTATSQLVVRPTAVYQGADNNSVPQVIRAGLSNDLQTVPNGIFSTDINVRFDTATDMGVPGQPFSYSYSTDGGHTWTQRQGNTSDPRLVVPGGYVDVPPRPGGVNTQVDAGTSFTIKPQRTGLDVQSDGDFMAQMNNVGKDVFGGQYYTLNERGQKVLRTAYDGGGENVFETVGKLISALETNNQDGVQQSLESLKKSAQNVTTYGARIGGRVDALAVTKESLITNKDDQKSSMSGIEDIDLTTLLNKLMQQQMAYSTVLKSSSMIMQLNLTQYV